MRTSILTLAAASVTVFALAACSHDQPPPRTAGMDVSVTETTNAPVVQPKSDMMLNVGPNLRKACGIDDAERAPKFDFDQANLSGNDRDIAGKVATCMTTGALKGQSVYLVGRADPRGTEQHNMKLGQERAGAFKAYLVSMGVDANRIQDTSRGAMDATGTSEDTWRKDRRVDIELAQ